MGCGNPLLGDDGFGPAVIEEMEEQYPQSSHVGFLDAGTSVRDLLFDLLLSKVKPHTLIIIDAVDHKDRSPGEIFEIELDQIPKNKIADYSIHQFPSTNMLKEIKQAGQINVNFYAVQVRQIPAVLEPGLSRPVQKAVSKMCRFIRNRIQDMETDTCRKETASC